MKRRIQLLIDVLIRQMEQLHVSHIDCNGIRQFGGPNELCVGLYRDGSGYVEVDNVVVMAPQARRGRRRSGDSGISMVVRYDPPTEWSRQRLPEDAIAACAYHDDS